MALLSGVPGAASDQFGGSGATVPSVAGANLGAFQAPFTPTPQAAPTPTPAPASTFPSFGGASNVPQVGNVDLSAMRPNPLYGSGSGLSLPTLNVTQAPTSAITKQPVPGYASAGANSGSVVDYLNSNGQASDFNSRASLAQQYGISNYSGTAAQNTQLLNAVKAGAAPTTTQTNSGSTVTTTGSNITSPSSFSIDTNSPTSSNAMASNFTPADVANQRKSYSDYVNGYANAVQYSPDYISAYQHLQTLKAQEAALTGNLATGAAPGDTQDFAQGFTSRALMGANAQEAFANIGLQTQELIRQGNMAGAKALLDAAAPVGVSPGASLVSPLTGQAAYGGAGAYSNYQAQQTFYNLANAYPDVAVQYNTNLSPQENLQAMQQAAQGSQLFYKKGYIPQNMFSYYGAGSANPLQPDVQRSLGAGAQNVLNAIQSGRLNPTAVNSRNAGVLGALYANDPNFNEVQATAAANFFQSHATQNKIAWADAIDKDFAKLRELSDAVSRTASPALNGIIQKGETQVAGDPNATAFVQAASRIAASLSNVLGDSGGSDFRTQLAGAVLDPRYSKDQLNKVLDTETKLVNNLVTSFQQVGNQPATGLGGTGNGGGTYITPGQAAAVSW